MEASTTTAATAERAYGWTLTLAEEIGPRRPTSRAERVGAEWLRGELARAGVAAELEPFAAYPTFGAPQGAILALGALAGLVPARARAARAGLALSASLLGALEDGFRVRPLSRLLARGRSQNLVATIESRREASRTLCLISHVDSSRSGLIFDPRVTPHLRAMITATSAALGIQAAEPLLGRSTPGRSLVVAARALLAGGLALVAERELRGEDVPGANDNASGAAVTAALAAEVAERPLEETRLMLLVTGAEEAGVLGADAFLRRHDTSGWLFINFDGVAAPATLRYLPYEGLLRTWKADRALLELALRIERDRPELGLERMVEPAGLTFDATAVLARGGRALTISAQDGTIPNYHQPTDDARNLDEDTLTRALEVGRELIAANDRGEADAG